MNVIDSLVVLLNLDASGYKKGHKESGDALDKTKDKAEKTNKEMAEGAKKAAAAYSKVRNELLGLITAYLGVSAVKSFVENLTTGDAAVGRLAHNLGMTTVDLSEWEGAVKRAGGSAEGMAATMQGLNTQMQRLWTFGQNDLNPMLIIAGINTAKFNDRATTMSERLLMVSDALSRMPRAKAQLFGAQLGLDQGTINLLEQGRTSVERLLAAQRGLNVVSERDAELAIRRQIAWQNLTDRFISLGRVLVNVLSPVVLDLLNRFVSWAGQKSNIDALVGSVREFAKALKETDWSNIASGLKAVGEAFVLIAKGITMSVEGWRLLYHLVGYGEANSPGNLTLATGGAFIPPAATSVTPGMLGASGNASVSSATTTSSISIGNLNVITQAHDAKGIAADLGAALNRQFGFAIQSNSGVR